MKNEHYEIATGVTAVKLTRGCFALVDTKDLPKIAPYEWYTQPAANTNYAGGYARVNGRQTTLSMGRVLLGLPQGVQLDVDHADGNGLNNSSLFGKLNISVMTRRQNQQNRHNQKSSQFPGVSWHKKTQKWRAQIHVGVKHKHLGLFKDEGLAAQAYREACNSL